MFSSNLLIVGHIPNAQLGILLLRLQLQFNVQHRNQWALVVFGLHLKAGIAERLFEGNALDQSWILIDFWVLDYKNGEKP